MLDAHLNAFSQKFKLAVMGSHAESDSDSDGHKCEQEPGQFYSDYW